VLTSSLLAQAGANEEVEYAFGGSAWDFFG